MKKLTLFAIVLFMAKSLSAQVSRVEPTCWWVGMKNPKVQLMVYGKNISDANLTIDYAGVNITGVHKTSNPNYLFVDLNIAPETKAGMLKLHFQVGKKKYTQNYELKNREQNQAGQKGFDKTDVLYLIMPDRFANGNPKNDTIKGMLETKVNRKDQYGRHGGDIAGVMQHLDYLSDLGVTAIWFNPMLENNMPSASYHGYATTDYYKVDPRYGTNEEYVALVKACHDKGMKVVMDMIFNHCGSEHWWMKDLPDTNWINNGGKFLECNHKLFTYMDPYANKADFDRMQYGWFVKEMPDLNQKNPFLATYLVQNSIWWIEFTGIDGIRQDTYPYADFDFMADWCRQVEKEYPEFNIVGESWYAKEASIAWWQRNSKLNPKNTHLKTVMDFPTAFTADQAFTEVTEYETGLYKLYLTLTQDFLYPDPDHILVFLDNHDMSRFNKKGEKDLNRYKQAVAFLLTTRGIPQIYYGTEILMYGEKSEGDGMLRKDFPGGWNDTAKNAFTAEGRTKKQNEAFDYMRSILHWRKTSDAIANGKLIQFTPTNPTGVYAYARQSDKETVFVIMNGTDNEISVQSSRYSDVLAPFTSGTDVVTGKNVLLNEEIKLPKRGVYVLQLK